MNGTGNEQDISAKSVPGWQPIEAAPKVGSGGPQIFLYSREQGYSVGTWRHNRWVSIPGTYGRKPTHWMPLPEPPK